MEHGKITSGMSTTDMRTALQARDRDVEIRSFQHAFGVFGDVEKRSFSHSVSEVRHSGTTMSGTNDGTMQIVGHAAVFNKPSVELRSQFGAFIEYIDPHAFDNVLRTNPPVVLTWDHESRWVLGNTQNKTLELRVDGDGLRYWSRVAPTSYAADLQILMDGGYLDQSSFLFRVAPGGEDWSVVEDADGNEIVQRRINEVGGLFDVCVCVSGAYPDTSSGLARTLAFNYALDFGYLEPRKAIPFKATGKAPEGTAWDAGAQTKGADADELMAICAWYDPSKKDADGNLLAGAFKLPHHLKGSHDVVWNGVKAAMSRLNQSNTQIPEGDRQGVYNHLKKHYAQFDQDPPTLRSQADIDAETALFTQQFSNEVRALGDVAWGQEEGVDDLTCDIEAELNADNYVCAFSVCDVSIHMNKAIVCDWTDYTFWVVPFQLGVDDEPVVSDQSEWQQVETAWVTTSEGYEANISAAKTRREARMADAETEVQAVEAPEEIEGRTAESEVEATEQTPEVTPEGTEPVVETPAVDMRKQMLAEARLRIVSARIDLK